MPAEPTARQSFAITLLFMTLTAHSLAWLPILVPLGTISFLVLVIKGFIIVVTLLQCTVYSYVSIKA
jgi:hypothetical protein